VQLERGLTFVASAATITSQFQQSIDNSFPNQPLV
jgi:hypothetical protein